MSKIQNLSPLAESRVVLVTGGTRGIGAAIVRQFVEAGDHVEYCYHSRSDLSLDGVFNVCRAVSMSMIRAKSGVIINISSISGVFGNAGQANYSASKSGIIGLSKSLAKELGPFGVRVNVVAPGFIETDMTRDLTRQIDKLMKSVPLRRMGHSDEVAHSVAFLSSDQARYITGQTLGVDGGLVF